MSQRFYELAFMGVVAVSIATMGFLGERRLAALERSIASLTVRAEASSRRTGEPDRDSPRFATRSEAARLDGPVAPVARDAPTTRSVSPQVNALPSEARVQADALLEEASRRGRWTEAERARLDALAPDMRGEEYIALLQTLAHRANMREIVLEGRVFD